MVEIKVYPFNGSLFTLDPRISSKDPNIIKLFLGNYNGRIAGFGFNGGVYKIVNGGTDIKEVYSIIEFFN
jgi:hypothetical protein